MAVVFESLIKINEEGKWYIELTDTVDGRVAVCEDLDEYSQKVEDLLTATIQDEHTFQGFFQRKV